MKINITKSQKDLIQFKREINWNRKDYFSLIMQDFDWSIFCFLFLCIIINSIILICTFYFWHTTFSTFLVINIVLFCIIFLCLDDFGSSILSISPNEEKIEELQIKYDKYIEIKQEDIGCIKANKIKKIYETESFIFILFQLDTIIQKVLIKKDELGNFKNRLIEIVNTQIKERKIEEEKNKFHFIAQNIHLIIIVSLYLSLMIFLSNLYPMSKIKDSQISVSEQKFIYLPQNSQYLKMGLTSYDIPLEINGIDINSIKSRERKKLLKENNVKLKVLKKDTKEIKEYIINKDSK